MCGAGDVAVGGGTSAGGSVSWRYVNSPDISLYSTDISQFSTDISLYSTDISQYSPDISLYSTDISLYSTELTFLSSTAHLHTGDIGRVIRSAGNLCLRHRL